MGNKFCFQRLAEQNISLSGNVTSVILISEYRAYDTDRGLEYHVTGTAATRQHIRNFLGYLSLPPTKEVAGR